MAYLTTKHLTGLLADREPPCLSIYQPTHRHHPDNQQDPIRFKNQLRAVAESLQQKYSGREVGPLLDPLQALGSDKDFWNHTLDGLAVLAAADAFHVFRLQRPVPELAIVADRFQIKPLLRIVQSADRYQVLCLTGRTAKIWEGNRDVLDPVEPESGDFPATLTEALGEELTEPHRTVASYGKGAHGPAMHHGHGGRKDEIDKDTERYFRAVDRAVAAEFSKPSGLPLILVALPEYHATFRSVSQNPALIEQAVDGNPDAFSADALREAAWKAMEPRYLARLAGLSETFQTAQAHRKGTADLSDAARAAVEGRVATLLVEAERVEPGRLDPATGAIVSLTDPLDDPGVGNMLDDVAELVLRTGGEVVVVPADRMPTASGLAATYKF